MNKNLASAIKSIKREISNMDKKVNQARADFNASTSDENIWGNGVLAQKLEDAQIERYRLEKMVRELEMISAKC